MITVANGTQGAWDSASAWRLVEEMRIEPADSGPTSFSQISVLEVDDAGRIYLSDYQSPEIRVFGSDGALVRLVGRKGDGPGEFRLVTGLLRDSIGQLIAVDQQGGRYSVFDSTGRFVTSHQRHVSSSHGVNPWPGRLMDDARLADVGLKSGTTTFEQVLVLAHPGAPAAADSVELPDFEQQYYRYASPDGGMRVQAGVPFAPSLTWYLDPRGYLWSGVTGTYQIHQLRLNGDTVRTIQLEVAPAAVTSSERDTAVARLEWFTKQGGQVDASRIPSVKPAFVRLMPDDQGYLWVLRSELRESGTASWDVFDPEGRFLGQVTANCLSHVVRIVGNAFYSVCTDDDGLPSIVRYRIAGR